MQTQNLDHLHRQLSLLARRYQLRGQQEPLAFGLTVSEGYALGILVEHPPLTMGQLAGELNLSLAAVTKIVTKLCELDLAARASDKQDKRVQLVSATSKGKREYSKLQAQFKGHLKKNFGSFTKDEIALIAKGLENINSSIDKWREIKSRKEKETKRV